MRSIFIRYRERYSSRRAAISLKNIGYGIAIGMLLIVLYGIFAAVN